LESFAEDHPTELDIEKEGVIGFEWSMAEKHFLFLFFAKKRRSLVVAVSDKSSIETNILIDLNYLLQINGASIKIITGKQKVH
jgi:hypothetical protein|tara:strand:- start:142 stop:390 length:249 start_codon:yes stop_codon:yes gene_type:complete